MRAWLVCLLLLASVPAGADPLRAANRLREGGIVVLALGVGATIVSQILVGEGIGWELGNGLGEHYAPTPAWVPAYETAGWTLLAGGQAAIVSGVTMLSVGEARRDRARAKLGFAAGRLVARF